MVDREVADRLLGLLEGYVHDLAQVKAMSFAEYSADLKTRRFAERTLQIAIEASLDLGNHIIADEGLREPEDNRDVFRVLAEEGIIDAKLLENLQPMASFRNLIVHDYAKIDDEIVFGIVQRRLDDFTGFARKVIAYLNR